MTSRLAYQADIAMRMATWAGCALFIAALGCCPIATRYPHGPVHVSELSITDLNDGFEGDDAALEPISYEWGDAMGCCSPLCQTQCAASDAISRLRGLGYQCSDRIHGWCAEKQVWYERKKAEKNAPPWPRFHPVPVKPVFSAEAELDLPDGAPETYGRFGKTYLP